MSLQGCSLSSLECHGDLGRYPMTGKKKSQEINPKNYRFINFTQFSRKILKSSYQV